MYHNSLNSINKFGRKLFVWSFVLVVLFLFVAGRGIAAGDIGAEVLTDGTIPEINFIKDAGIRKALGMLAALYNKNIVPTPGIDGELAFTRLKNVTFDEAMDAILGGKFEYEQKGNLIEVYPTGDVSRMKHAVFPLHYISAAEAEELIKPVLSGDGAVGVTSAAETGVPTGESISTQTGGGDTMSLRDTIVIYDYAENIRRAEEVITAIDVRPKQVLIEATILSATLTEGMEFGIDLNLLAGVSLTGTAATDDLVSSGTVNRGTVATTPIRQIATGTAGAPMETAGFAESSAGLRIGITGGNFAAFITALESVTDITILANPKILAVNKQLGQVYIGDKIGYDSQTTVAESGTATSQVEFLDTGTKLSFRPYISVDGYIRMDIHAKDSAEKTGGVISETSTEMVSNIMVKDGETIVIGGLFRNAITTIRSQVPLLGDLPFVGGAFRGTNDRNVRQEIIVMLTPHIINEPSEANGSARAEDISRKGFGAKEGLQWAGRTRLVEDRYAKAAKYYVEGDNEAALKELKTVLELRPTYLEAIRLKERIISETDPEQAAMLERNVLADVEREATRKWRRR
ncbi:MAG: type II secretion system protein GspD [Planctomycetota bacterium]|jgi:type IV pilus assembly protein PilQ